MANAAVQTAIYELGYKTGDSTKQLNETRAAADHLVKSTDNLTVSEEKVTKATRTQADAMDKLLAKLDPRIRAEQNLQRVQEQVQRIQQQGIGTTQQHARAIELAQQKVDKFAAANDNVRGSFARMSEGLGQVNRLLGVFGVTIGGMALVGFAKDVFNIASNLDEVAQQAGVSTEGLQAYRAAMLGAGIAQQETDRILQKLTRTIGEANAGAGAQRDAFVKLGLTADDLAGGTEGALPKIAAALLQIESASERAAIETDLFGKTGQKLESALKTLIDPTSTLIEKQRALGQVMGTDVTNAADEAADRLTAAWNRVKTGSGPGVTWLVTKLAELIELSERLDRYTNWMGRGDAAKAAEAMANRPGQTIPALEGIGGGGLLVNGQRSGAGFSATNYEGVLSKLREEAALTGQTEVARARIVALREAEAAKIKDGNGPLSEAEKLEVSRLATVQASYKAAQDASKAREEALKKEKAEFEWLDEKIFELAAQNERENKRRIDAAAKIKQDQDDYIQGLRDDVELAGLSREEQEVKAAVLRGVRDLHIDINSAQAKEIAQIVRNRQETERWREVVDDISMGFENFFEDVFTNGKDAFTDLWDTVKSSFIRMLAQMAQQALINPIIMPIFQSLGGGILGGNSGGGLGSLFGGNSFGSPLSGISDLLGLGGGFAGVPASALTFGGQAGLSGLSFGSAGGLSSLFGGGSSALTFGGQAANAGSIFNFTGGGGLFSGGLGSALGGIGLGSLASSLLFGNKNDASLGGMGGAAAGAAIGSIIPGVGTVIGGLLGGLLGGGLGSITGSSNQGAISNFTNDGLGNTLFKAGGGNNGALATQATSAINQYIKALQDAGVSVSLGNISGLSVGSDKSYVYDFAGGKQKLAGGEAGVQATVDAILARILPGASGTTAEAQELLSRYGGLNAGNLSGFITELQTQKEQRAQAEAQAAAEAAAKAAQDLADQFNNLGNDIKFFGDGLEDAARAARNAAKSWESARDDLNAAKLALTYNAPGLSPVDIYNASRSEFDRLLNSARGGSAADASALASFSDQFLQSSFSYNGSTTIYGSDLAYVKDALLGVAYFSDAQRTFAERQAEALEASIAQLSAIYSAIRSAANQNNEGLDALRAELEQIRGSFASLSDAVRVAMQ